MRNERQRKATTDKPARTKKTSLLQATALVLTSLVLFSGLLEGVLTVAGFQPVTSTEDPLVGFAGNIPLFSKADAPNGPMILTTSKNKLAHFNRQTFVAEKAENSYRIFCLGGSTTYGRPYNDLTSFASWLRELLPKVQPSINWEVINAGGISYASYRVARLMEELTQYKPDLFIVYTGQNEFLEERTYRDIKKVPEVVRTTVGVLSKTRTWAAMNTLLEKLGMLPNQDQPQQKHKLSAEVDTILDHSSGPEDYQRNDALQEDIKDHFRLSLEQMVATANRAGAKILFVAPASNLKDCSPFKSEHTDGLDAGGKKRSKGLLSVARLQLREESPEQALSFLDEAIALDPRHAELHYQRGKALFSMQRYDEALDAFRRAVDEDVCPLRAKSSMPGIISTVASENGLPLVDFHRLVEKEMENRYGYKIPGEELFLDHVHPTVAGHKLLAIALMDKLLELDILQPNSAWSRQDVIKAATENIETRIDVPLQIWSLINLSKVMHWAGKFEDAERSAKRALTLAGNNPALSTPATNMLIKLAKLEKDDVKIDALTMNALSIDPWNPILHYQRGMSLLREKSSNKAAAHFLLAAAFGDENHTNSLLGLSLYQRGYYDLALPLLDKALRQEPGDGITRQALNALRKDFETTSRSIPMPRIVVQKSPAGTPQKILIQRQEPSGQYVTDGFSVEWYATGAPKYYREYGRSLDVAWDAQGQELTRSR